MATCDVAGRKILRVLPRPTSLWICTVPLCPRTMPRAAAMPRPRPVNLVVKKGSKSFSRVDGSMPQPLSETSSTT